MKGNGLGLSLVKSLGVFSKCNYTNGAMLQFKVGQTLYLKGNLINGATQRVMYMNGGTIFGGGASEYIKMVSVGGDKLSTLISPMLNLI